MNEKEWFRGIEWDSYNKAQYIRIKASYLLGSKDTFKESEGCKLMERVIHEYPTEISHIMFAYEELGNHYFNKKNYKEAEFNYRKSISYYKENGRSGTSGIADIKLAEIIVKTDQLNKFSEMYNLLIHEFG